MHKIKHAYLTPILHPCGKREFPREKNNNADTCRHVVVNPVHGVVATGFGQCSLRHCIQFCLTILSLSH